MTAAIFCLVCASWMFVGFVLEVFWFNFILNHDPSPVNLLLFCARAAFWPLIVMEKAASGTVRVFGPYLKGVFWMKRKLFTTLLMLVLGGDLLPTLGYQPQIFSRVAEWWNAPPAPPSPEAQRLITSLESGEGWKMSQASALLVRGDITITTGGEPILPWEKPQAFINVNDAKVSQQFNKHDRARIHDAAEKCLRRLTAQALEASAK